MNTINRLPGSTSLRRRLGGGLKLFVGMFALFACSLAFPLPDEITRKEPVHSVRVTDRFGHDLRVVGSDGRFRPVALEAVSEVAVRSLIATEDRSFYSHKGISIRAIVRSLVSNAKAGRVVSGGSTLTMQVARAIRDHNDRNVFDKLIEMHLALRLELHFSKADLIEQWLNRVSFGNRIYGIEEAASFYFNKSAADLTDSEATMLIGLPQSPSRLNPIRHIERAKQRQQTVVAAAVSEGVFSRERGDQILASTPQLAPRKAVTFSAPHFVDYVQRIASGEWKAASEVRTTIDPQLQDVVERLGQTHLEAVNKLGVSNVSAIVLENGTGNVLAYLGSADYWDAKGLGQNDGVQALRQPGSALKPFAYAAAFRRGILTPLSVIPDLPVQVPGAGGAFAPVNYDNRFHGPVTARTALACSYNVPAIRLAQAVTPAEILKDLHSVGFTSLNRSAKRYGVGLVLGNGEVTLMDLAGAYSALARGGILMEPRFIDRITSSSGDTLHYPAAKTRDTVLDERISYLITDILSDPQAREPAFGRGGPLELPFPCATKTGTSKDYRDNIAVGYTPRHTVAVWAGNFSGEPMQRVSGISGAGPLLKAIFLELGSGGAFHRPLGISDRVVCDESGKLPGKFCKTLAVRPVSDDHVSKLDTCTTHLTVYSDRRTGEVATISTPIEYLLAKDYLSLPPIYDQWMKDSGNQPPPRDVLQAHAGTPRAAVSVVFPMDGTAFQIDPVLRSSFQRIQLRAAVSSGVINAEWWIDGVRYAVATPHVDWTLQAGWHSAEIRGILSDGRIVTSTPSRFFVGSLNEDVGSTMKESEGFEKATVES